MEENWDDDDFEPKEIKVSAGKGAASNKWEGEDEDDDVKESWEDEEEEKDKSDKSDDKPQIIQKPKKKSIAEKIAEKERLKREEIERRMREEEVEELSPEERLRQQKQSDLKLALETTFGGGGGEAATDLGIDGMCPESREDFDEFANTLMKKIQPLVRSTEYPNFAENLVRSICATLTSFDLKKIKTTIDNLYLEKQKIEKGDKTKKNKGKGKVKLKLEQDNNQYSAYAVDDYDDFNDFM